ncbi:MAG TPA: extracellular solute-binding protein [Roseiarcus sp.]|nr:extracellular solute-binding protein [Roseiarcus sp.]
MTDQGSSRLISRRRLLKTGVAGFALTSAIGIAPRYIRPAHADTGLAPGMTGGPTGFAGAERYQYNPEMPEGRAIEGIKALKAAGKAPSKLVFQMSEGAIGQLTKSFPADAPTIQSVWEKETGIKIEIVGVASGNEFTKVMQDISTKGAAFDIYQVEWNRLGDLTEAGGLVNLDEYVAKYKPEWDDPKRGYTGGVQGVTLLNKYNGSHYAVSLDGDFQTWIYRKDLFENSKEQADFKAKFGRDLHFPETWDELTEVASFFHRPDKGLFGCTDLRNQGWGYTNWYQRYCSMAAPNKLLFDDHGKALINSPEGVKAAQGYVDGLKYHSPDAISWGWPEQYGNMASGNAAITCAFSNMPKFLDSAANAGSKVTGKLAAALPPGTRVNGKLIRRSVLWFNLMAMVSTQSKHPEAAYLFLQWLGGSRTFSWMSSNPAGYFDPFQLANFDDPLVQQSYHPYQVANIRETIKRAVPSINYAGASSYHKSLDDNLMAALTGNQTAEQAMAATAKAWDKVTRRIGEQNIVKAIQTSLPSWPTLVD